MPAACIHANAQTARRNPHTNVDAARFCEEYFTFTPEGTVTRTIRKGEEKIDDR